MVLIVVLVLVIVVTSVLTSTVVLVSVVSEAVPRLFNDGVEVVVVEVNGGIEMVAVTECSGTRGKVSAAMEGSKPWESGGFDAFVNGTAREASTLAGRAKDMEFEANEEDKSEKKELEEENAGVGATSTCRGHSHLDAMTRKNC